MSLVVFPFKNEDLGVVARNLSIAAGNDRVTEVWAIAAQNGSMMDRVVEVAADIADASDTDIVVFPQDRIGQFRLGKGDGMNTALARSAERGFARTHFYDADITNFDESWIEGAELAADSGFDIVRHRFPRAATDAMVTWMITRPGLAKQFPGTILPTLGQPLGGEITLSADVVTALAEDPFVRARSDWGIDTVITHATATLGRSVFEHNAADGKRHALYGSLTEIKDMVLECLDAVATLRDRPPVSAGFEADPPTEVPNDLKTTVAYDLKATLAAIATPPDTAERRILALLDVDPDDLPELDEKAWGRILDVLLASFRLEDKAWREAVFRLWVLRVVHYTRHHVPTGYDSAMTYLESTIRTYEAEASACSNR